MNWTEQRDMWEGLEAELKLVLDTHEYVGVVERKILETALTVARFKAIEARQNEGYVHPHG